MGPLEAVRGCEGGPVLKSDHLSCACIILSLFYCLIFRTEALARIVPGPTVLRIVSGRPDYFAR